MKADDARKLIEDVAVVRHPCHLDLLVFLARHARSLVSSDQLARLLGYARKDMVESLDALLDAGLIKRLQIGTGPARLYVFAADRLDGGSVAQLVSVASTRVGRLALLEILTVASNGGQGGLFTRDRSARQAKTGPVLVNLAGDDGSPGQGSR